MVFSDREGYKVIKPKCKINDAIKNRLLNILTKNLEILLENVNEVDYFNSQKDLDIINELLDYLCLRTLDLKNKKNCINNIVNAIEKDKWYKIYDTLEKFIWIQINNKTLGIYDPTSIIDSINSILKQENCIYRLNDNIMFVALDDEEEIKEVNNVLNDSPYNAVKTHLGKALDFLSSKNNPDYENSIKESISAVESVCCNITNNDKATLGDALKEMKKDRKIHSALIEAFSKLYGYTSDSSGIRHAGIDFTNATYEDARFMLITCSAFINYATKNYK